MAGPSDLTKMKFCITCEEIKYEGDFPAHRNSCKACLNAKKREWQKNNKDKMEQYKKDYLDRKEKGEKKYEVPDDVPEGYRWCKRCESSKPLSDFKHGKGHCYECQKTMSNEWKAKNKEKVAVYNKTYKAENKEEISEYNKQYDKANRAAINERVKRNHARLKEENPSFKIACTLRNRIYILMKINSTSKAAKTLDLLGCEMEFFMEWLAFNFEDGMTFANHGDTWHLDHTVPCSMFNLVDKDEQKKCFHWSNMKPMYANENIAKNNKATSSEIKQHEERLGEFIAKNWFTWEGEFTLIEIDRLSYI